MEANAGKSFQMQIIFNIFPRISLYCKLVSVQYWEYEYGLLWKGLVNDLLSSGEANDQEILKIISRIFWFA